VLLVYRTLAILVSESLYHVWGKIQSVDISAAGLQDFGKSGKSLYHVWGKIHSVDISAAGLQDFGKSGE